MSAERCEECQAPAEFEHHESPTVTIYVCARHRCTGCYLIPVTS